MGRSTDSDVLQEHFIYVDEFLPQGDDSLEDIAANHGWCMIYNAFNIGKKGKLWADSYGKVENGVFYMVGELNTSEYAAGGAYSGVVCELPLKEFEKYTVFYDENVTVEDGEYYPQPSSIKEFALGTKSLEKFMTDFGITAELQNNEAVSQTL